MSAQEVQLAWQKDFNIATELAKSESKPMLVYFSKSDCKECVQFYTNFFKQKAFKELVDDFVLVMLDGFNTDMNNNDIEVLKHRRLVMHYNKNLTFPAVLTLNNERQEIGEIFTSLNAEDMTTYINLLKTFK